MHAIRYWLIISKVNAGVKEQTIYRVISSEGSFGANPLQAQIGLGKATKIKQLTIAWPNAQHTIQNFESNQLNQFFSV